MYIYIYIYIYKILHRVPRPQTGKKIHGRSGRQKYIIS